MCSDAERQAVVYAEHKQKRLMELIHAGSVAAFPDALRFVQAVGALGWPMAVASSSKNANQMMRQIHLDSGRSLLEVFTANVCGRDLRQGKPNPEIFLLAAAELHVAPAHCFVVEDAPAGIEAARAGGMAALGVARLKDASELRAAGADLVVTSLDDVAIDALADGRLCQPGDMMEPGMMDHALKPTADAAWVLEAVGYDPLREGSLESRFAISNGFLGIRGARAITRGARWVVPPHTYVAGLFDTLGTKPAIPELVPAADWLKVRISLSGRPLVHHPGDASSHRMTLDLRRGALLAECGLVEGSRRWHPPAHVAPRVLSERAVGLQLIQLEIEDGEVEVTLEASFEGINLGLVSERLDQDLGVWRTQRSGKSLAMATASSLQVDGHDLAATAIDQLKWSWSWKSRAGQIVCFERTVAVARSDTQGLEPWQRGAGQA